MMCLKFQIKYIKRLILSSCVLLFQCKTKPSDTKNEVLQVVTTTTMLTDLVTQIGGDVIAVNGLMGSGVDPHLYKATEGDVSKLVNANVIIYNGLHLEGKLVDIFEKIASKNKTPIALGHVIDKNELISSAYFDSNYDPHVWFDIDFYKLFAKTVAGVLSEKAPKHGSIFQKNLSSYLNELELLQKEVASKINTLPQTQRILVTAHDAFNYFGKAYNFEVVGLQGLSTATEAGVKDVQRLSRFIIEKQIKAIFVETSVPKRTIEALQAAVIAKGHKVKIGGSLYSDALGSPNSPEGTYIGMYRYNVNTIVNALQ